MKSSLRVLAAAFFVVQVLAVSHKDKENLRETEKEIGESFKAAYSNRTDELEDFFNKTFHGKPSEVADRFRDSWDEASTGVKEFVMETYRNITKVLQNDTTNSPTPSASVSDSYETLKEKIDSYVPPKNSGDDKSSVNPLDSAWGYFKSVFGVDLREVDKKSSSLDSNTILASPEASTPMTPERVAHSPSSGLVLGLFTLAAGVFLLYQSFLSNKSIVSTAGGSSVSSFGPQHQRKRYSEVPSGYVRIT